METQKSSLWPLLAKELVFLLIGFIVGYGGATGYFIFLAPKPEPVIVEKVVTKVVVATSTLTSNIPAKTYDFHTIKVLDDKWATTTISNEDQIVVGVVLDLLKKDKNVSSYVKDYLKIITTSSEVALAEVGSPKDGGSFYNFVIDLKNNKITDSFLVEQNYFVDKGTFIIGNDISGLRYYIYGATSSIKIPNSNLTGNQSYYQGMNNSHNFKVIGTTTNSITFGVFEQAQEIAKQGTTTEEISTQNKKVGERMFIIP